MNFLNEKKIFLLHSYHYHTKSSMYENFLVLNFINLYSLDIKIYSIIGLLI